MKFSATDWSFQKECRDPERYFSSLVEIGIDAIELIGDAPRRQAARDAGLEILNMAAPGMKQGPNRLENHDRLTPAIRDRIHQASEESIPHLIVFSGCRFGEPDESALANCRRAYAQLIPTAAEAGVTLILEMLNHFDHPDYQAARAEFGFQLCEQLHSPYFKTLYDIYHMERMGSKMPAEIIANLDKIAHLHLAEAPSRDLPKADGQIPYQQIVPAILRAEYAGYWEWHSFKRQHGGFDRREAGSECSVTNHRRRVRRRCIIQQPRPTAWVLKPSR